MFSLNYKLENILALIIDMQPPNSMTLCKPMARILFARILVTRSICLETCSHISILFLFMSFETGSHYESRPDMELIM